MNTEKNEIVDELKKDENITPYLQTDNYYLFADKTTATRPFK